MIPDIQKILHARQPFALIAKQGRVTLYQGPVYEIETIHEIHEISKARNTDMVFALPYRAIRERGFEARGDAPILAMAAETQLIMDTGRLHAALPDIPLPLAEPAEPEISDTDYAGLIRNVIETEIEGGNISQVTISRRFQGRIADFGPESVLSAYRRLLARDGAYMTVLFVRPDAHDPGQDQYLLAATPERHLEIAGTESIMNPIAGTLRKEDRDSFRTRLNAFLSDPKEVNELFQVMDEEMKMMGRVCPQGGTIYGPFLREVGAVVHTEYELIGRRSLHSIDALRETLHAPTVTGSPMESAARVIARYEPQPRRYYAGEIGLYRQPRTDLPDGDLDSAILIRGAEISGDGSFTVQAGGGIVRDSDPENEARESRAKAQGLLAIFTQEPAADSGPYLTDALYAECADKLAARNAHLSPFWMQEQPHDADRQGSLKDLTISIINNEDNFAYMLAHMAGSFQAETRTHDTFDYDPETDDADIVILGPGPGDPNETAHPRMQRLHEIVHMLRGQSRPVLGICLGHQFLALHQGIPVRRQPQSTQGMQMEVRLGTELHRLGFYNSFSPVWPEDGKMIPGLALDIDTQNRVIAMAGPHFIGYQFHPESVMSESGAELLRRALVRLRDGI